VANILILDERTVRNLLTLLLRRQQHLVRQASTSAQAWRIAEAQAVDLLLADVKVLDGTSGISCALRLIELRPKIRVLFTSGVPPDAWNETDKANLLRMPKGSFLFLEKPLSLPHLSHAIDHLLAHDLQGSVLFAGEGLARPKGNCP
jgi:DNA-binding NtrC family response regulator